MTSEAREWQELIAQAESLDRVAAALGRERAIRECMVKTGETREVVEIVVGSVEAMDEEAVLDLTDGEPTTLSDALSRYVIELGNRDPDGDELTPIARVRDELGMILSYPWPS